MKKFLIIFLLFPLIAINAREINDSIDMSAITGTDTILVVNKSIINFGTVFGIEFEYTDLNADDATVDIGTRLGVKKTGTTEFVDSTFNSYSSITGATLPFTLNATSNADSYYDVASVMIERSKPLVGSVLLIKITKGSVTSGILRWTIKGF